MATGLVIHSIQRRHRALEFKKFLNQIDQTVPVDFDVHLICDNLATHKTPAIGAWLAAHPRFHLHFTPTSSSWLNQVERWFGLLTDRQLRRGVHDNVTTLERDIRFWIEHWNADPKPPSSGPRPPKKSSNDWPDIYNEFLAGDTSRKFRSGAAPDGPDGTSLRSEWAARAGFATRVHVAQPRLATRCTAQGESWRNPSRRMAMSAGRDVCEVPPSGQHQICASGRAAAPSRFGPSGVGAFLAGHTSTGTSILAAWSASSPALVSPKVRASPCERRRRGPAMRGPTGGLPCPLEHLLHRPEQRLDHAVSTTFGQHTHLSASSSSCVGSLPDSGDPAWDSIGRRPLSRPRRPESSAQSTCSAPYRNQARARAPPRPPTGPAGTYRILARSTSNCARFAVSSEICGVCTEPATARKQGERTVWSIDADLSRRMVEPGEPLR